MNSLIRIIAGTSLLLISSSALSASTKQELNDLKTEVAALKEGQAAIQKDLGEIKKLLEKGARAAAPGEAPFKEQVVSIGKSPYLGDVDATVTLIEFSDYQCPYCSRNYKKVMPTLINEYVDTSKLKFVMRESPIASIHSNAVNASLAALCANNQGKYWEMHNMLFENQSDLGVAKLKSFAAEIGLNTENFNSCLDNKEYQSQVDADLKSAADMGVRGTPGFVLGLTDPDDPDKALMTVYIRGAQPLDNFKKAIDKLLESVN